MFATGWLERIAPVFLLILAFLCQNHFATAKCNHTQVENCTPDLRYCHCIPCKVCPPGQGLEPQCGSQVVMQFPRCLKCIPGETYSQKNSIASCHPCPICDGKKTLQPCNLTHPTICGDGCKDGYEMNTVTGMCEPLDNDDSLTTPSANPTSATKEREKENKRSRDNNTLVIYKTTPTAKPSASSRDESTLITPTVEVTSKPVPGSRQNNRVIESFIFGSLGLVIGLAALWFLYKKWALIKNLLKRITRCSEREARDEEVPLHIRIPDSVLLNTISPSLEQSICTKLNKRTRGVKNWRDIGHDYGVDRNDLETMEQAYHSDTTSPAKCLLETIHAQRPQETLNNFINILRKLRRNDIVQLIEKEYSQ